MGKCESSKTVYYMKLYSPETGRANIKINLTDETRSSNIQAESD
jgi:hypothetical protein